MDKFASIAIAHGLNGNDPGLMRYAKAVVAASVGEGQEPVAKLVNGVFEWHLKSQDDAIRLHMLRGTHLLYTRPAPQPVALTDEELSRIPVFYNADSGEIDEISTFRAVIAAHEAKQQGGVYARYSNKPGDGLCLPARDGRLPAKWEQE